MFAIFSNTKNTVPAKLGTLSGVFIPTVLTILGAIMYLREGWVVGNAGLGGALLIIFIANAITAATAMSISSVATNIRVRAGGLFQLSPNHLDLKLAAASVCRFIWHKPFL